jgi:hypothetical protein
MRTALVFLRRQHRHRMRTRRPRSLNAEQRLQSQPRTARQRMLIQRPLGQERACTRKDHRAWLSRQSIRHLGEGRAQELLLAAQTVLGQLQTLVFPAALQVGGEHAGQPGMCQRSRGRPAIRSAAILGVFGEQAQDEADVQGRGK